MFTLPALKEHGITVVIGLPGEQLVLEVIAQLARRGPVQVIVGANRFDAHYLARIIRRHTVHLDQTLEHIQQARPFTCYQMIKLLAETHTTIPLVVSDMLTTFYDESISETESIRLTKIAAGHLERLGQGAPVLATLRLPLIATRLSLIQIVQAAANHNYIYDSPEVSIQPSLW
jgi:hypothetical protein